MSLARLIAAQRDTYGIPHQVACRALGVSPAWFYKWCGSDRSLRRKRRAALAALIAYLFARRHGTYGSPRITWSCGIVRVLTHVSVGVRPDASVPALGIMTRQWCSGRVLCGL